ncbi:hypothetical protein NRIC_06340 [Enterococcus florum]|uniref:ABC transporter substrate-binding protein PnrA-like domain-containing protein n=1 Tax=Enterococcus florum TaxID=2480627 RepID=A0A4P5PGW9_9ENTE|nr:BMP family ABC transporter substrate-binding protein [Enterococcus florum]GCF92743.1 hypothetical protein NRIC_06340 [Enterococcus florum]
MGKRTRIKSKEDYTYVETNQPQDNSTNISQAVENDYDLIISLSYLQADALKEAAELNPEKKFALIDDTIEGVDNSTSATFRDNESAYLAGIAAAYTTRTNKAGFIGDPTF